MLQFTSYPSILESNNNFKITNNIQQPAQTTMNNCIDKKYFQTGGVNQVLWGANKPLKETCPANFKPHTGIPNHSLWHNLTKRTSLITKE